MRSMLALIILFLVILYISSYVRHKKRRGNIDTVGQFRRNYLVKSSTKEAPSPTGYRKYVTKYNSPIDYIEKDKFIKEASAEIHPKKLPPKQLKF